MMDATPRPVVGRIMALDVGSRRIGVAVSDPLGITAQGFDTIQRQNKRRDLEALRQVLEKYDVREIVVGLPLRLSGAEGTQSEKMRRFADDLHAHFGLTVHLWDERWTSTEANRLLRETDLSIKKRGQAVDRMAAILILQSWMEAHHADGRRSGPIEVAKLSLEHHIGRSQIRSDCEATDVYETDRVTDIPGDRWPKDQIEGKPQNISSSPVQF